MVRGSLFVVSAPSGGGKRTVLEPVFAEDKRLAFSVSATTRKPREGESEGVQYYFMDRASFRQGVDGGDFVEWAEVHGNLYGTRRDELERLVASGKDVILELDVQGMRNLHPADFDVVSVFIEPPSMEELERRLRSRGTESEEDIELRLINARAEMAARNEYDYIVINDQLETAVADFRAIVRAQRCRATRQLQET
jgi:guanylate kinase